MTSIILKAFSKVRQKIITQKQQQIRKRTTTLDYPLWPKFLELCYLFHFCGFLWDLNFRNWCVFPHDRATCFYPASWGKGSGREMETHAVVTTDCYYCVLVFKGQLENGDTLCSECTGWYWCLLVFCPIAPQSTSMQWMLRVTLWSYYCFCV